MQPINSDLLGSVRKHNLGGSLLDDGTFHYVVFLRPVRMRAIIRTQAEPFTQSVARRAASFDVIVNGNYFGLTTWGKIVARMGKVDDPSSTIIEGEIVSQGRRVAGTPNPDRFFLAEVVDAIKNGQKGPNWHYEVGHGSVPLGPNVQTAIGDLGPLLQHGLRYGVGNRYRPPVTGPTTGEPGPKLRGSLTQRNDRTFSSVEKRDERTGKTFIAWHALAGALLVGVEKDHDPDPKRPGASYGRLVTMLSNAGFTDAVFCDGSDSAMMWYKGRLVVRPGKRKDDLMTVGIGFAQIHASEPARPHGVKR